MDKFTLDKGGEYVFLYRNSADQDCPYGRSGRRCGSWCPHFDVKEEDKIDRTTRETTGAVYHDSKVIGKTTTVILHCTGREIPLEK